MEGLWIALAVAGVWLLVLWIADQIQAWRETTALFRQIQADEKAWLREFLRSGVWAVRWTLQEAREEAERKRREEAAS